MSVARNRFDTQIARKPSENARRAFHDRSADGRSPLVESPRWIIQIASQVRFFRRARISGQAARQPEQLIRCNYDGIWRAFKKMRRRGESFFPFFLSLASVAFVMSSRFYARPCPFFIHRTAITNNDDEEVDVTSISL